MEEKLPYTYKREKQRFSIRKTKAWGACSVFLGTSILFLSAGTVARADTTADASTRAQVVVEQKTTVNTESTGSAESSANSTSSTVSSPSTDSEAEATTPNQNKSTATNTEKSASETQSSSQNSASSSSAAKAETTSASSSSAAKAETTSASSSSAAKAETTSAKTRQTVTKISYNTLLQQLRTSKALATDKEAPDKEALTHVTKDNFLDYFSLNGSATYDPNTGIVTITPDENDKVGNFSLKSKIDMNSSFKLTGQVNLGNKTSYRGGADGIGFAFHNGNTTDVGNAGGNLGIGGLQNAIGFKLDTWHNDRFIPKATVPGAQVSSTDSNGFGWSQDPYDPYDPYTFIPQFGAFVTTDSKEITAIDGNPYQRWWATTDMSSVQELSSYDLDGEFHNFVVSYDGDSRLLTINYTEATRNVLTWVKKVDSSYQAMAMIISASTGGATNLQQFKITSFDFKQAATVNVKYVDTTGHPLAQGTVNYPDGAYVNGRYTTKQLAIPNYRFIKMGDKSLDANGTLTHVGDNGTVIYVYTNQESAKVTYIDDTTKTNLDSKDASGKFGQAITFPTAPADEIANYEKQGYVLVSNNFKPDSKYQANDNSNVFEVHLKHGTKNVSRKDDVNMTVHYVMDDNSEAPSDNKQTVNFTENGIQDLVTKHIDWTPAGSQTFKDVVTPKMTGYKPDKDNVAGQTVHFGDSDINVTVYYSANTQTAKITYIDDTTKTNLDSKDASGKFGQAITFPTAPADEIANYEKQGYVFVSNSFDNQKYQADDSNNVFEVHLKHGTITVTPENPGKPGEPINPGEGSANYPDGTDKAGLTDTVNRTITYVMIDGSKAPDAVHDSLSYTASKVIDKVNGEVLETRWSANQDFKDVDSPSVKGNTPDKKTVSNKNVAHDAADITETVKYNADAQKASVIYVDDKTGKTLKVDNLNGVTNAKSGYTTKAAIDTYTGLGYTLVSDDTNGNEVVFDNDDAVDQAFTVHLSHGTTTVTPDNPGHPGEPVDPDNPDGPKYPDGTEEYQVKRTGTQIIHYVGASDKTPADNNQTFIFTREITFDNVTGNIISVTPWNAQSHTFGNVDTPVIPGYHADKAVAGGATVTPDDLNRVITVTYALDGNPGDQGDTPTPEPTPEPEPTPNPTPDDQPDSEISSDEHFENVKPKDKLDKTNPKKVDAYKKQRKIIKTKIAKQGHTEIAEPIEDKVTRENNVKVVSDPVENKAAEPKLPQTGEADNSIIGLLGMLLASFAAMFGFDSLHSHDKKHKN